MSKNDGGPAFPVNELNQTTGHICAQHMGATLRDYFAAKAMQELLRSAFEDSRDGDVLLRNMRKLGGTAYGIADLMLKARSA